MAMTISKSPVEHFTPSRAELRPFHKIHCQEADCDAIFTNSGNYDLHLQKHHKIVPQRNGAPSGALRLYHCPESECVYSWKIGMSGRHFKHMKNLRQHFQKVHVKSYICELCGRAFPTEGQFQRHADVTCGKRFNCGTCGWNFETKEALTLHVKRKGHTTPKEVAPEVSKTDLPARGKARKRTQQIDGDNATDSYKCLKSTQDEKISMPMQHKDTQTNAMMSCFESLMEDTSVVSRGAQLQYHDHETQTELQKVAADSLMTASAMFDNRWHAIYHDTETQTDAASSLLSSIGCSTRNDLEDFQALHYHDIETQTELTLQQHAQRHTSPPIGNQNSNSGGGFLDQMLAQTPLAHMHTQTCDDYLLSELGLTDIQTQTKWSSFGDGGKHMYTTTTSTSTSTTTGFAHDELLVSTETQTSFTQCLLDSTAGSDNAATCTTGCGNGEESNTSNYAHLYNTQHTQTCDLLLEGLFGGQENDLIAGFQSTYTQT